MLKDELLQHRRAMRELPALREQTRYLEGLLAATQGKPCAADLSGRALRLHAYYQQRLVGVLEEQLHIEDALCSLDRLERMILHEYYSNGVTWEIVCEKLPMSWKHVHRLHRRALDKPGQNAPLPEGSALED